VAAGWLCGGRGARLAAELGLAAAGQGVWFEDSQAAWGGCGTLDSCESASGAGRIDTSEAARFALRLLNPSLALALERVINVQGVKLTYLRNQRRL
jgi:hypothetical protein